MYQGILKLVCKMLVECASFEHHCYLTIISYLSVYCQCPLSPVNVTVTSQCHCHHLIKIYYEGNDNCNFIVLESFKKGLKFGHCPNLLDRAWDSKVHDLKRV